MTEPTGDARASVPDHLLQPLLEAAADTLRSLEATTCPWPSVTLRGFDRRGLMHGPGPRRLRRAIEQDADFRERVLAGSPRCPQSRRLSPSGRTTIRGASSRRRRRARISRCSRPRCGRARRRPGADFGLGLVVAFDAFERRDRGDVQSAVVHNREIAGLKEALRRANDARQSAEAAAARTAQELRDERRARRTREENAEAETQAAYGHAESVESQLRQTETELESERARVGREQQRARAIRRGSAQGARRARGPDDGDAADAFPSRFPRRPRARRCHRRDATPRGEARIVA